MAQTRQWFLHKKWELISFRIEMDVLPRSFPTEAGHQPAKANYPARPTPYPQGQAKNIVLSKRGWREGGFQQAAQTGQPTRPQASHNPRRTLSGTLKTRSGENPTGSLSQQPTLEESRAGV